MKIKAVIFDMDGLMFDTETTFTQYFPKVCLRNGIEVPESIVTAMIGCDFRLIARYEKQYPGITKSMEQYHQERLDAFFEINPASGSGNKKGLENLIAYLNQENIPYAIASSSTKEDIERLVKYGNCDIQPQEIISSKEKGIASKPEPDIFLEASRRLNVNPIHTLVLEDSKNGVIASRRANMISIFVPDHVAVDEEMKKYIQYTCKDLDEVKDWIIEQRKI